MQENSIDLIATDQPYGIAFMGKDWDKALPSTDIWRECLRVLKPGAFAFVMSAPRQDVLSRTVVRLEDAGFVTSFTPIYWTYASGFPKAYNIAKGVEGKLQLGTANWSEWNKLDGEKLEAKIGYHKSQAEQGYRGKDYTEKERIGKVNYKTEQAKALEGSYAGFQPKPAVEVILTVMKPLSEKTYVDQALTNGKGITWLDDCRIPFQDENDKQHPDGFVWKGNSDSKIFGGGKGLPTVEHQTYNDKGRFPANLLVSDDILNDGKDHKSGKFEPHHVLDAEKTGNGIYGKFKSNLTAVEHSSYGDSGSFSRFFNLDKWAAERLPKDLLQTYPFIIEPKSDKAEKNKGLANVNSQKVNDGRQAPVDNPFQRGETKRKNTHPTVKPIELFSYLITLGSRHGDIVLDPFMGSGTTCIAAKLLRRGFIGIEINEEYYNIAQKRLEAWYSIHRLDEFVKA